MPQLHHRDPSIIGLLGASPHLASPFSPITSGDITPAEPITPTRTTAPASSEALSEQLTPPQSPVRAVSKVRQVERQPARHMSRSSLHLEKGKVADMDFERPFYELIVDGIHSHPNSVRVSHCSCSKGGFIHEISPACLQCLP